MIRIEFAIYCTDCSCFICMWHHNVLTKHLELEKVVTVPTSFDKDSWNKEALCEKCALIREVEKRLGEEPPL